MQKINCVKKLVSQLSHLVLGTAMLLSNDVFAASVRTKSNNSQTTGRIRQGSVLKNSPNNILSLKEFNNELKDKVDEYQMVASFTSIDNIDHVMATKVDGSKSAFSGSVSATYSQSLVDHEDGTKAASNTISASLSAALSENYTLSGQISATQDVNDQESDQANGVSDLGISLAQKRVQLADWLKGGFNISSTLPVSKYSREYQGFQGSIGASYSFSLTDEVLAKGFKTGISIGGSRNFHEFETDASGRILNPYSMKESLSTSYEIKDFSISFDFLHRHAWNYKGSVSEAFELSQELGYSVTPQWGVALGHSNAGSWLAPNGRDSNLKLINEDDSIIYGSMSLMF